jgi:hypothetical protein
MDGIPQEELEWQFPLLERYQINDYSNQGFGHKDSTDPSKGAPHDIPPGEFGTNTASAREDLCVNPPDLFQFLPLVHAKRAYVNPLSARTRPSPKP